MNARTVERARNRWREILPQLGIETTFLSNRHGPCPLCGGRDRYRFDDPDGTGSYFCNQCGAGSGLILVRKLHGWDHKTACGVIDKIIGSGAYAAPTNGSDNRRSDTENRAASVTRLLSDVRHPGVVSHYLIKRGVSVISTILQ
jgi:putative DNA primase/helicase